MARSEEEQAERDHRMKTIFIRAHVSLACDGDKRLSSETDIGTRMRTATQIGYFINKWDYHGGWD